jgi:hypothetical protein
LFNVKSVSSQQDTTSRWSQIVYLSEQDDYEAPSHEAPFSIAIVVRFTDQPTSIPHDESNADGASSSATYVTVYLHCHTAAMSDVWQFDRSVL